MKVSHVHHVAIQVKDLNWSKAFYVDLLGLPVEKTQPHSIWVNCGWTMLMLEKCDGTIKELPPWKSQREGLHLLALAIKREEREAWRERLVTAGFPIEHETPFTLYCRDPDGTRIGLSHWPDDGKAPPP